MCLGSASLRYKGGGLDQELRRCASRNISIAAASTRTQNISDILAVCVCVRNPGNPGDVDYDGVRK